MKYTLEILIKSPRAEVIKKLDNIDNIKHWQRGLVSIEHMSGIPGQVGAKMKLSYKFGKRQMDLIETITKRDFPDEFDATYETKDMFNYQQNIFKETPEGYTKWISHSEFIPSSLILRIMAFLMPGAFKKQSKKYLEDFKDFVETGNSVAEQ